MKQTKFKAVLVMVTFIFASFPVSAGEQQTKQVVVEKIQEIKNPQAGFKVELKLNKKEAVYNVGEIIKFKFKSNKDCYITLLDVGTDGKVTILFPNKFHKKNKIKAGKFYSVPGKDAKWQMRIKGPAGKEVIKAIATLEPKKVLKKKEKKAEKPGKEEPVFEEVDDTVENVTKNITIELKPVDVKKWAEAEQVIKVEEKEKKEKKSSDFEMKPRLALYCVIGDSSPICKYRVKSPVIQHSSDFIHRTMVHHLKLGVFILF
jgi:hypothetical protein